LKERLVCLRPTTPAGENLLKYYSEGSRHNFLSQLDSFIQSAKKALDDRTNQKDACRAWQSHFGKDRFPFESE